MTMQDYWRWVKKISNEGWPYKQVMWLMADVNANVFNASGLMKASDFKTGRDIYPYLFGTVVPDKQIEKTPEQLADAIGYVSAFSFKIDS